MSKGEDSWCWEMQSKGIWKLSLFPRTWGGSDGLMMPNTSHPTGKCTVQQDPLQYQAEQYCLPKCLMWAESFCFVKIITACSRIQPLYRDKESWIVKSAMNSSLNPNSWMETQWKVNLRKQDPLTSLFLSDKIKVEYIEGLLTFTIITYLLACIWKTLSAWHVVSFICAFCFVL